MSRKMGIKIEETKQLPPNFCHIIYSFLVKLEALIFFLKYSLSNIFIFWVH